MPRKSTAAELQAEEAVTSSPLRRSSRIVNGPNPAGVVTRRTSQTTESQADTPAKATRGRRASAQDPEEKVETKPVTRTRRASTLAEEESRKEAESTPSRRGRKPSVTNETTEKEESLKPKPVRGRRTSASSANEEPVEEKPSKSAPVRGRRSSATAEAEADVKVAPKTPARAISRRKSSASENGVVEEVSTPARRTARGRNVSGADEVGEATEKPPTRGQRKLINQEEDSKNEEPSKPAGRRGRKTSTDGPSTNTAPKTPGRSKGRESLNKEADTKIPIKEKVMDVSGMQRENDSSTNTAPKTPGRSKGRESLNKGANTKNPIKEKEKDVSETQKESVNDEGSSTEEEMSPIILKEVTINVTPLKKRKIVEKMEAQLDLSIINESSDDVSDGKHDDLSMETTDRGNDEKAENEQIELDKNKSCQSSMENLTTDELSTSPQANELKQGDAKAPPINSLNSVDETKIESSELSSVASATPSHSSPLSKRRASSNNEDNNPSPRKSPRLAERLFKNDMPKEKESHNQMPTPRGSKSLLKESEQDVNISKKSQASFVSSGSDGSFQFHLSNVSMANSAQHNSNKGNSEGELLDTSKESTGSNKENIEQVDALNSKDTSAEIPVQEPIVVARISNVFKPNQKEYSFMEPMEVEEDSFICSVTSVMEKSSKLDEESVALNEKLPTSIPAQIRGVSPPGTDSSLIISKPLEQVRVVLLGKSSSPITTKRTSPFLRKSRSPAPDNAEGTDISKSKSPCLRRSTGAPSCISGDILSADKEAKSRKSVENSDVLTVPRRSKSKSRTPSPRSSVRSPSLVAQELRTRPVRFKSKSPVSESRIAELSFEKPQGAEEIIVTDERKSTKLSGKMEKDAEVENTSMNNLLDSVTTNFSKPTGQTNVQDKSEDHTVAATTNNDSDFNNILNAVNEGTQSHVKESESTHYDFNLDSDDDDLTVSRNVSHVVGNTSLLDKPTAVLQKGFENQSQVATPLMKSSTRKSKTPESEHKITQTVVEDASSEEPVVAMDVSDSVQVNSIASSDSDKSDKDDLFEENCSYAQDTIGTGQKSFADTTKNTTEEIPPDGSLNPQEKDRSTEETRSSDLGSQSQEVMVTSTIETEDINDSTSYTECKSDATRSKISTDELIREDTDCKHVEVDNQNESSYEQDKHQSDLSNSCTQNESQDGRKYSVETESKKGGDIRTNIQEDEESQNKEIEESQDAPVESENKRVVCINTDIQENEKSRNKEIEEPSGKSTKGEMSDSVGDVEELSNEEEKTPTESQDAIKYSVETENMKEGCIRTDIREDEESQNKEIVESQDASVESENKKVACINTDIQEIEKSQNNKIEEPSGKSAKGEMSDSVGDVEELSNEQEKTLNEYQAALKYSGETENKKGGCIRTDIREDEESQNKEIEESQDASVESENKKVTCINTDIHEKSQNKEIEEPSGKSAKGEMSDSVGDVEELSNEEKKTLNQSEDALNYSVERENKKVACINTDIREDERNQNKKIGKSAKGEMSDSVADVKELSNEKEKDFKPFSETGNLVENIVERSSNEHKNSPKRHSLDGKMSIEMSNDKNDGKTSKPKTKRQDEEVSQISKKSPDYGIEKMLKKNPNKKSDNQKEVSEVNVSSEVVGTCKMAAQKVDMSRSGDGSSGDNKSKLREQISKSNEVKPTLDEFAFSKLEEYLNSKADDLEDSSSEEGEEDESEAEYNEFIDGMAEEGEEDTPSEDSNQIIDEGESIGSRSSEEVSEDDYDENDSFICDEEAYELLSGDEYDLDTEKSKKIKKSRIIDPETLADEDIISIPKKKKVREEKTKKRSRIIAVSDSSDEEPEEDGSVFDVNKQSDDEDEESSVIKHENSDDSVILIESTNDQNVNKDSEMNDESKPLVIEETKSDSTSAAIITIEETKIVNSIKDMLIEKSNDKNVDNSIVTEGNNANTSIQKRSKRSSLSIQENIVVDGMKDSLITKRISSLVESFCSTVKQGEIALNLSLEYEGTSQEKDKTEAVNILSDIQICPSKPLVSEEEQEEANLEEDAKEKESKLSLSLREAEDLREVINRKNLKRRLSKSMDDMNEEVEAAKRRKKNNKNKDKQKVSSKDKLTKVTTSKTNKRKKTKVDPAEELRTKITSFSIMNQLITDVKNRPKRTMKPSKPDAEVEGSWTTTRVKNLKPSTSPVSKLEKIKMQPRLHPKDFKNQMLSNDRRVKRIDTKTLLKNKGAYN